MIPTTLRRSLANWGVRTMLALGALSSMSVAHAAIGDAVNAHLNAGEFGQATDLALTSNSPEERTALLQQIAAAQAATGEFQPSRVTLSRISDRTARQAARRAAAGATHAGGGLQPDFRTLELIIMENTSATNWDEIDGGDGAITPFPTGVRVDGRGLLERQTQVTSTALKALRENVRTPAVNQELQQSSGLRLVSLKRLEQAVAQRLEDGLPVPESMSRFAGLTSIEYVFVYPEDNDIVVGGPAEGWAVDAAGRAIGTSSQQPVLSLDDFVTVLRAYSQGTADFGCSINTREAGVKALMEYAETSQQKGPLAPAAVKSWVNQLQKKLGRQDIVVWGIPADSHAARTLVEADYRMKLVGVDQLDLAKEVPSYFDLLPPSLQKSGSMDALRWWLTLDCQSISHSPDRDTFQLSGTAVKCQSENQLLTADGKHLPTGLSEATNRQFAENFTTNYDTLAANDLVFGEAKNIFELAMAAAIITHEKLDQKVNWNFGVFAAGESYDPAHLPVPTEVDSVVNHRVYNGKNIVVQVAGGVRANAAQMVGDKNRQQLSPRLETVSEAAARPQLPEGRWWWDTAR